MNNVRVCITHAVIINESCLYSLVLPYVGLYTPMPESFNVTLRSVRQNRRFPQ